MRKSPVLFSIILMAVVGNSILLNQSSYATYQENNITWWTVDELLDFSIQQEREISDMCGNNIGCRQEQYFNNLEREDGRYRALDRLRQSQFNITSINPEQETIEILFFDQDAMLSQMGIEEHYPLNYVFLAWFNQPNGNIGNYTYSRPDIEQFPDDLHIIYSSGTHLGANFPSNRKFNLPTQQTGLKNNSLGRIYAATFGEQYNSKGFVDYSDCINAEDYTPGTECQLMITADYASKFMPPRNNLNNNFSLTSSDTESQNENNTGISNDKSDTALEEDKKIGNDTDTQGDIYDKDKTITSFDVASRDVLNSTMAKAPETGANTASCEKVIEFPWWLIILLIIGDIAVIWLFWPRKYQNP